MTKNLVEVGVTRAQRKALETLLEAAEALNNSRDPKAKAAGALVAGVAVEFRKGALTVEDWEDLGLHLYEASCRRRGLKSY